MSKLVALVLEPDHAEPNGFAFYAYFKDDYDHEQVLEVLRDLDDPRLECGACSFSEEVSDGSDEVPNALTAATGLRRFFVCQGV
jgi:hypothetical protein